MYLKDKFYLTYHSVIQWRKNIAQGGNFSEVKKDWEDNIKIVK
jgi:hypothetical protein